MQDVEESIALNKSNYPKVVISASGMATAGRIRHHLKHNLWNPLNSLVFVGYQAEGTLGRILLDGAKKVKLLGEEIAVELEIYDLEGFSAHTDQGVLLDWISKFNKKPKKIFLVHGEDESTETLSGLIKDKFNIDTIIPDMNSKFELKKNSVNLKGGINIEPALLEEDLKNELNNVYNRINSLLSQSSDGVDKKVLSKNYNTIKNNLLELKNQLIDLNILLGK